MGQSSIFGQIDEFARTQARSGIFEFSLPADVIPHFARNGLNSAEIDHIIGDGPEVARLVEEGAELTPEQTDRATRLAHIVSLSEVIFGKREEAFLWLRLPNRLLGNSKPIDLISREAGSRLVEEALLQIEYGIYA